MAGSNLGHKRSYLATPVFRYWGLSTIALTNQMGEISFRNWVQETLLAATVPKLSHGTLAVMRRVVLC